MNDLTKIEQRRAELQSQLDLSMSQTERNQSGQFATPAPLANELLQFLRANWRVPHQPIRFLEPSLGTGAFYSALRAVFPKQLIRKAVGIELHQAHADTARELWRTTGLEVRLGDFTTLSPSRERFNLVVANPPYVRHHHLPRQRKEQLQQVISDRLGLQISGLAGLYCHFMLLADAWLDEGALSLWLLPSEFLDVNYGVTLKRYLTDRVRLTHVHRFCPSDVQFEDALVSSAVVVFEKRAPAKELVTLSFGPSILNPQQSRTVNIADLDASQKWSRISLVNTRPSEKMKCSVRLADLFTIKRGLATGDNHFFILRREEAKRLGIPTTFVRPILPSPRNLKCCIVETETDGYPKLDEQLVLIDCPVASEEELGRKYPDFMAYLEAGKKRKVHTGYLVSRRVPWYSQERRPAPPLLCTYMGRSGNQRKPFRFIWNKSMATAHNVYLLMYPKGVLRDVLIRRPEVLGEVYSALCMIEDSSLVREGRVYGGGLHKLEPKELGNLPADFLLDKIGCKVHKQTSLFEDADATSV